MRGMLSRVTTVDRTIYGIVRSVYAPMGREPDPGVRGFDHGECDPDPEVR